MADTNVVALKKVAAKICPEGTTITGDTIAEVIACIEAHYVAPTGATKLSELTNDTGFITEDDVPKIPDAPLVPGDYKLSVDSDGNATWVAIE